SSLLKIAKGRRPQWIGDRSLLSDVDGRSVKRMRQQQYRRAIAFKRIARLALASAEATVRWLLPDGRRQGRQWVALNPRRADRHLGSFRIGLNNGRWADFAMDSVSGGDLISLVAYVRNSSMKQAALDLARQLGIDPYEVV